MKGNVANSGSLARTAGVRARVSDVALQHNKKLYSTINVNTI